MKKFLSLVVLILTCFTGLAQQNMVPNGNFETFSPCPNGLSQTSYATGWIQFSGGSSDYFNACATTGGVGVPTNTFGYQYAASGNGYVGGYQDASSAVPYKEYVSRPITPLQIGATYEVSISVSLANVYGAVAVDDIGIFFFDNGPTTYTTTNIVPVVPQINFSGNGAFADTQNWVRLVKTFVADSAYDNIAIGSFKDPATVVKQQVGTGTYSYYYFDSVVVKTYDSAYIVSSDTLFCAGDSFDVQYNISKTGIFGTGNVFTVQLSDPTGSFASDTVNIGSVVSKTNGSVPCKLPLNIKPGTQYKIRLLASKPKFTSKPYGKEITIGVHPQDLNPTVGTPLCAGDAINLNVTSSTADVSYKWKGPGGYSAAVQSPSISNANSGHNGYYVVTASVLHCTSTDSVEVFVTPYPVVSVSNNSPVCIDSTVKFIATSDIPGVVYTWTGPANFSGDEDLVSIPNCSKANAGTYNLTVSNDGCTVNLKTEVEIIDIEFNLGEDVMLCNGETKILSAGQVDGTYLWQNGSMDTTFTVREKGIYKLEITHPVCGLRTDDIEISYEKCECEPFVPNAFTPNSDGHNDKIGPLLDCRITAGYKFIIINRFGEVVFKSTIPGEKWDGVYKGQKAELSTYYYLLQLTGPRDKQWQFKGDIVLIR